MHGTAIATASLRPAETMYAALSPRAPAYVHAPSIALIAANPEPSRLETLRRQIEAAQKLCERPRGWR